jgi:multidrug efflux pump subunit AcrB
MGRAAKQVRQAVKDAGEPPRGVHVEEQGQLRPMTKMFEALAIGLAVAAFVILVLLTAYSQSPHLALSSGRANVFSRRLGRSPALPG